MNALISLHNWVFAQISAASDAVLPTLARLIFTGVLFGYFWSSANTKPGEGILGVFSPSPGAYIQIFPKTVEALGYDTSQLGVFHWLVAVAGTVGEFVLPILLVIGLFSRIAALGMIVFIAVQSWVDITGHNLAAADIGYWFDKVPSSLIVDQRAFWVFVLLVIVMRGAGPVSVDRILTRRSET